MTDHIVTRALQEGQLTERGFVAGELQLGVEALRGCAAGRGRGTGRGFEFVSWDDDIVPTRWKNQIQTTNLNFIASYKTMFPKIGIS